MQNDFPTLEWPPQSPDVNIIENVWKVIKTKVQRRVSIENDMLK
jgi:transposase